MIEALRGLGYSTATAIADIIDNSITASARSVDLRFDWSGPESRILILDDGDGMDDAGLEQAMRLGEKNPLNSRSDTDLGRFGIGLKTASFSQCRCLTVASKKKDGNLVCLCWDLDFLSASADDGWHLLEGPNETSRELLAPLVAIKAGTLVLWERLDCVAAPSFSVQNFLDLCDSVERHLAMVFHRYMERPNPGLQIRLNGRPIAPWDPFLSRHPATWTSPLVLLKTARGKIDVQGHVLPHKDRLSQNEHDVAAGPDGWTAQQGFYVYRNRRLLVAGSWLGLGLGRSWTKEEAHRLARIRLDLPNSTDEDWKIDIRKSIARPPVQVRPELIRIAEDTRSRARRVFAHRGKTIRIGDKQPVVGGWRAEPFQGGMRYRIDPAHPAVSTVLEEAGPLIPHIKTMLRILEETLPVQRIWLDTTEGRETPRTGFAGNPPNEVKGILDIMFQNMVVRKGLSPAVAKDRLLHTDPFQNYPDLVAALPDETSTAKEVRP
ncbi:MAG: ATP-binding protein [Magnetococcales bacterium]|nr:ATP-binding protein [Magnetococcales bacterium]MBF0420737.1 ATP-binding protein [Magnetococcales bacterium]